jgi:hypothetical protein
VLTADLVIRATGVRPNVDFLEQAGIDVDQGGACHRMPANLSGRRTVPERRVRIHPRTESPAKPMALELDGGRLIDDRV